MILLKQTELHTLILYPPCLHYIVHSLPTTSAYPHAYICSCWNFSKWAAVACVVFYFTSGPLRMQRTRWRHRRIDVTWRPCCRSCWWRHFSSSVSFLCTSTYSVFSATSFFFLSTTSTTWATSSSTWRSTRSSGTKPRSCWMRWWRGFYRMHRACLLCRQCSKKFHNHTHSADSHCAWHSSL